MGMRFGHVIWVLAFASVVSHSLCTSINSNLVSANKVYLVQVKHHHKPLSFPTHADWYSHLFHSHTSKRSLLYTYDTVYSGFAAAMSPEEAESLRQFDSVLQVQEDKRYNLHTTRTPGFLGLDNKHGEWPDHSLEQINKASENVIVGVFDTGVWPESQSFRDDGMPDVPDRWHGKCDFDTKSHLCNKKLIGAQFFLRGHNVAAGTNEPGSARDNDGHGTHTASTAAGSQVVNANLFDYAKGDARGMAYRARLAAYKVCGGSGCFGTDIVAAMDRAVLDGVDVLSLSLGGHALGYFSDQIAIAAFTAIEKGILVSCSAGNDGPSEASVVNLAPWIMTIGAGTLDRNFPAFVTLGNGKKHVGTSLYSGEGIGSKFRELVYPGGNKTYLSNLCLPDSLDPSIVHGKVVLCDRGTNTRVAKGEVVMAAGGLGMILANTEENGEELVADSHLLPAVAVGRKVGDMIRQYVKMTKNPTALLTFGGTVLNVKPAPMVAAFSARGPNNLTPEILKPDLIGPGLNILAAWSNAVGPTGIANDTRRTEFNIISVAKRFEVSTDDHSLHARQHQLPSS